MSTTIGTVRLRVVRLPQGSTMLDPTPRGRRGVRLVLPLDEGVVLRAADGSQCVVGNHDLVRMPGGHPATMILARPASVATVDIPADAFGACGSVLPAQHAQTHPSSPLVQPVREFVLGAIEHGIEGASISAAMFEQLLADMVASLPEDPAGAPPARPDARASLYEQALAHIAMFRDSAALDPAQVARSLRVSLRQLQRAFEEQGSSPAREIRRQRTEAALAMLADAAFDDVRIPEIAVRAGFGNDAEMRRAVAVWTGTTPSHLRGDRPPGSPD